MDRASFFSELRRSKAVFGTSLSTKQVQGVEAILNACKALGVIRPQTAYILARAYGETGGKMQPVEESLYYREPRVAQVFGKHRRQGHTPGQLARRPQKLANVVYGGEWGKKNLGNTQPGDGYKFRGRGLGQITGRRNYTKWGQRLGLDLVGNPDLLMSLDVSVRALARPMLEGWATGRRLDEFVTAERVDFLAANAVWNGNLDADKYARYAEAFDRALYIGGWKAREKPSRFDVTIPSDEIRPGAVSDFIKIFEESERFDVIIPKPKPKRSLWSRIWGRK